MKQEQAATVIEEISTYLQDPTDKTDEKKYVFACFAKYFQAEERVVDSRRRYAAAKDKGANMQAVEHTFQMEEKNLSKRKLVLGMLFEREPAIVEHIDTFQDRLVTAFEISSPPFLPYEAIRRSKDVFLLINGIINNRSQRRSHCIKNPQKPT